MPFHKPLNIPNNCRRVIQYDLNMNEINRFESITKAAKSLLGGKLSKLNSYTVCIFACCSGYRRAKKAYGFIWRYDDEKS